MNKGTKPEAPRKREIIDTPRAHALVAVLMEGPRGDLNNIKDPVVREQVRAELAAIAANGKREAKKAA